MFAGDEDQPMQQEPEPSKLEPPEAGAGYDDPEEVRGHLGRGEREPVARWRLGAAAVAGSGGRQARQRPQAPASLLAFWALMAQLGMRHGLTMTRGVDPPRSLPSRVRKRRGPTVIIAVIPPRMTPRELPGSRTRPAS